MNRTRREHTEQAGGHECDAYNLLREEFGLAHINNKKHNWFMRIFLMTDTLYKLPLPPSLGFPMRELSSTGREQISHFIQWPSSRDEPKL